jgi:hypothetical protein
MNVDETLTTENVVANDTTRSTLRPLWMPTLTMDANATDANATEPTRPPNQRQ